MKLHNLIKTNYWLSVELIFLNLYPHQKEEIETYKDIFSRLQLSKLVQSDISIVLEKYASDEPGSFYVDVSGRKVMLLNTCAIYKI